MILIENIIFCVPAMPVTATLITDDDRQNS